MKNAIGLGLVLVFSALGCGSDGEPKAVSGVSNDSVKAESKAASKPAASSEKSAQPSEAQLKVTSPAFENGKVVPAKFTGEGEDLSPALKWSDVPEGTKEIVVIVDDPDAPGDEPWVHWVIYGIPPSSKGLSEAVAKIAELDDGSMQGKNSWPKTGYNGPMPPPGHGVHRYFYKVYAVGKVTGLEAGATKNKVMKAIDGSILAQGELMGTYERK